MLCHCAVRRSGAESIPVSASQVERLNSAWFTSPLTWCVAQASARLAALFDTLLYTCPPLQLTALCSVAQVNVVSPRCEFAGCTLHANYGHPGGRRRTCSKHKLDGMVREGRASSHHATARMSGSSSCEDTERLLGDHEQSHSCRLNCTCTAARLALCLPATGCRAPTIPSVRCFASVRRRGC